MQRYRSSIVFGNKQVFDQQRELTKVAIIAAKNNSESRHQNEGLYFLAKEHVYRSKVCRVRKARQLKSDHISAVHHFNDTKMPKKNRFFFSCCLQKAEGRRNRNR
jgi:hypothetical protein